uniref:Uncharacterized protein n=1 Tax=Pipistrellus kuhlii TaxID=59472 RepID=A0A7J7ZJ86_PIPKU|nr:hypothetical protein mPipKuh1_009387 [Pipistrellus kuhlii]
MDATHFPRRAAVSGWPWNRDSGLHFQLRKLFSSETGLLRVKQVVQRFKMCALQNTGPRECQVHGTPTKSFVITRPWQTKSSRFSFCGTSQSLECVLRIETPKRIVASAAFPERTGPASSYFADHLPELASRRAYFG